MNMICSSGKNNTLLLFIRTRQNTGQETGKEQNMVQEGGKDKKQTRTKQHSGSEQDKKQKTRYRKEITRHGIGHSY